jgi:hypothetical protein
MIVMRCSRGACVWPGRPPNAPYGTAALGVGPLPVRLVADKPSAGHGPARITAANPARIEFPSPDTRPGEESKKTGNGPGWPTSKAEAANPPAHTSRTGDCHSLTGSVLAAEDGTGNGVSVPAFALPVHFAVALLAPNMGASSMHLAKQFGRSCEWLTETARPRRAGASY